MNNDVKRRADVVGTLPNYEAIISLFGVQMLEINDEWAVVRRYMSLEALAHVSQAAHRSRLLRLDSLQGLAILHHLRGTTRGRGWRA